MANQTTINHSPAEYLELERAADYKSEYHQGKIAAMASFDRNHNRINSNVSG